MNLNILKKIFAAGLLLIAGNVFAQSDDPFGNRSNADTSISYKPPAVFVTKIILEDNYKKNKLNGKFTIWNEEKETINGLTYRIDLLDPLPQANPEDGSIEDNSSIYDRFVSREEFSLLPNERKDIPFSYIAPLLPTGKYRIQITATTSKGRNMGWWDADVEFDNPEVSFIGLATGPLLSPEYPDRDFPSQAGPNITPGKKFTLNVKAINESQKDLRVVPTVDIYEFDVARGIQETKKLNTVSVKKGQSAKISVPINPSPTPGVYYAIVSLRNESDEKLLSNLAEYRWVVKGESAEIMSIRTVKNAYYKDEEFVIRVDMVGSADAFTKTKVNLNVQVADKDGVLGEVKVTDIELTDGVYTTQGPIKISRNFASEPQIIGILTDNSGNEFDRYSVAQNFIPTKNDGKEKIPYTIIVIIGFAIGIIGGFIIISKKRGK